MEPRPLICGQLQLRQSYQLTDNCDEAEITRVGDESCGSGDGDDAPQPVENKRQVLLRKPKTSEFEFMVVSVTGSLTMESISSLEDPGKQCPRYLLPHLYIRHR